MGTPQERLPGRRDEILRPGARLQVTLTERGGASEVVIVGNRPGLQALAAICSGLAELTAEELLTPANHYHLDENFWGHREGVGSFDRLLPRRRVAGMAGIYEVTH
jgi:hypothetical protein